MKTIPILDISRNCNGCTACCDGWLTGEAHGHGFWPGRKCHYVSENGCTIYDQRPHEPCQTFACEWLTNKNFPAWLKPSLSKVIFVRREVKGIQYIFAHEAGGKMDSEVLSWFVMAYANKQFTNIAYQLNRGINFMGTAEFMNAVMKLDVRDNLEIV